MEILNDSVKSFEKLYLQLQDGFPVIVPTDTNYNLCSLPNNDLCIDKIFEYKKRSKDKPLSLFIDKPEDWKLYGDNQNTEIVDKLVEIFWPGPLNIILKNKTSSNYTFSSPHLRAHETSQDIVCRLLLEKKKHLTTVIEHGNY